MTPLRSRRDFVKTTTCAAAFAATAPWTWGENTSEDPEMTVFVGSYSSGKTDGMYAYRLDRETGALGLLQKMAGIENPSFLAIAPSKRFLYAVNEISNFEGKSSGAVSSFTLDPQTKAFSLLNQQPSHGGAPCYVTVDQTGKWVLTANYSGGNAAVYPVLEDGKLGPASDIVQHKSSSVNPQRQSGPHAHSIILDAANRYAFVADLGIDKVMIYRFEEGKLIPNQFPYFKAQPGAGPRHFTFHPNGKLAFLIQELNSTMTSLAYDANTGSLQEIQTLSTLPDDFVGNNSCADVHVHPSGQFLYGSNRGHDSIVIYAIEESTGKLTLIGHESTQGKTPRNFAIDPTGTFLLAANQDSNTVVSFRIDSETGKLQPTGLLTEIKKPVCLKFLV